jgi:hypothetical protein
MLAKDKSCTVDEVADQSMLLDRPNESAGDLKESVRRHYKGFG